MKRENDDPGQSKEGGSSGRFEKDSGKTDSQVSIAKHPQRVRLRGEKNGNCSVRGGSQVEKKGEKDN